MAKIGRPSIYTQELADEICRRIGAGESVRSICHGPPGYDPLLHEDRHSHMPEVSTVLTWATNPDHPFHAQYREARIAQMEYYADTLRELADEPEVARARLKSDNTKWLMARLASHKYGDRITTEVTGDGASFDAGVTTQLASVLAAAITKAKNDESDGEEDDD